MPRKQNTTSDRYNCTFPCRLRDLMSEKNITQSMVATAINKTRQTVSNYADGSSEPDLKTLVAIANYFDVSVDYLVDNRAPARSKNPDVQITAEYTGLNEEVINHLHYLSSSFAFKDSGAMENLNAFLSPQFFDRFIVDLNYYADEILAVKVLELIQIEVERYLKANNINTKEITPIIKNLLCYSPFCDALGMKIYFSILKHYGLQDGFTPATMVFADRIASIYRYNAISSIEEILNTLASNIVKNAQLPITTQELDGMIDTVISSDLEGLEDG